MKRRVCISVSHFGKVFFFRIHGQIGMVFRELPPILLPGKVIISLKFSKGVVAFQPADAFNSILLVS